MLSVIPRKRRSCTRRKRERAKERNYSDGRNATTRYGQAARERDLPHVHLRSNSRVAAGSSSSLAKAYSALVAFLFLPFFCKGQPRAAPLSPFHLILIFFFQLRPCLFSSFFPHSSYLLELDTVSFLLFFFFSFYVLLPSCRAVACPGVEVVSVSPASLD